MEFTLLVRFRRMVGGVWRFGSGSALEVGTFSSVVSVMKRFRLLGVD